ncbi:MAG: NAD-dependent epimerase/dehydratase family protein [Polyangiaceae bacterium]
MRVVVTGARGFVGRHVVPALVARGVEVITLERSPSTVRASDIAEERIASSSDDEATLARALAGSHAVVHLAALAHDAGRGGPGEYARINRDYSLRLARAAAAAGVARFVFLSTIKVHGDSAPAPLCESSPLAPGDAYAESKAQAERGLAELAPSLSTVSLRCPLVYGPGVRANFVGLLRAVARRRPLPFGAIANRRSLIYVENLADALSTLVLAPGAGASSYVVCDGEDLSTPELVRRLSFALGVEPLLVAVPEPLLVAALTLFGKRALVPRLLGSLAIDPSRLRRELSWSPPIAVDEGLARTARWYRAEP